MLREVAARYHGLSVDVHRLVSLAQQKLKALLSLRKLISIAFHDEVLRAVRPVEIEASKDGHFGTFNIDFQ
jgi:hypothetical protein